MVTVKMMHYFTTNQLPYFIMAALFSSHFESEFADDADTEVKRICAQVPNINDQIIMAARSNIL
jgi:hypothetical protein